MSTEKDNPKKVNKSGGRRWFRFVLRHSFVVFLFLSCMGMTVAGAAMLPQSGEAYGEQEALVGTAIHELRLMLFPEILSDDLKQGESASANMLPVAEQTEPKRQRVIPNNLVKPHVEAVEVSENKIDDVDTVSENEAVPEDFEDETGEKTEEELVWHTVDESYFSDALFIGDSRQQGFGMYSGLDNATVYAEKGYQIYTASTKPIVSTPFGKITLADALALQQHQFKKVYIMFGLNEMGSLTDEKMDSYFYNLIDYIKQMEPGAVIYIESIIHVTEAKAKSNNTFTNDKINARNKALRRIAKKEGVIYLDLNEVLSDENGALFADAASDGIHLKSKYIQVWKQYIMTHAYIPEQEEDRTSDQEEYEDEFAEYMDSDDEDIRSDEFEEIDEDEDNNASPQNNLPDDGYEYVPLTAPQQALKEQLDQYYSQMAEMQASQAGNQ